MAEFREQRFGNETVKVRQLLDCASPLALLVRCVVTGAGDGPAELRHERESARGLAQSKTQLRPRKRTSETASPEICPEP